MIPRLALYGLAGAALIGGVLGYGYSQKRAGIASGKAEIQAKWDADTLARDKATAEAIAAAESAKVAALQHNQEVEREYQEKLAAVTASRDQYVGLFERARDQVRKSTSDAYTGALIAFTASEAERTERIRVSTERVERACERVPAEARMNADQLDSLIEVIRPQL